MVLNTFDPRVLEAGISRFDPRFEVNTVERSALEFVSENVAIGEIKKSFNGECLAWRAIKTDPRLLLTRKCVSEVIKMVIGF